MISKQTHLMLFLAMTLSAGSIVAMEKAPQQIGTEKALQTIEIGKREILAIIDRPWYQIPDKFQIPKEGALLKVTDASCYTTDNNFEIKQGTEYISLSRGDAGELVYFEIKDNRGTLLTTIYLLGNEQK